MNILIVYMKSERCEDFAYDRIQIPDLSMYFWPFNDIAFIIIFRQINEEINPLPARYIQKIQYLSQFNL